MHSQLTRTDAMKDRRTGHDVGQSEGWVHDLAHLPMLVALDSEEAVACDHSKDSTHKCRL